jgi:hypothetical protein
MGKNYANRKPVSERPESDFYSTPISLVWELSKLDILEGDIPIYEPADGNGAITDTLCNLGYSCHGDDIRTTGKDFLQCTQHYPVIASNPPFSLFDEFVLKAKEVSNHIIFIAKTNFFGAYKRQKMDVWDNLKSVHIFNRQVDYRTPTRDDGLFHVGNLITGWFEWDSSWDKPYWETSVLDVNKYARLGQFKE